MTIKYTPITQKLKTFSSQFRLYLLITVPHTFPLTILRSPVKKKQKNFIWRYSQNQFYVISFQRFSDLLFCRNILECYCYQFGVTIYCSVALFVSVSFRHKQLSKEFTNRNIFWKIHTIWWKVCPFLFENVWLWFSYFLKE